MIQEVRDTAIRELVKGGASYRQAARKVGCSLRTVQRALMPPSARKAVQVVERTVRRKAAAAPVSAVTTLTPTQVLEQVARSGDSDAARVSAARVLLEVERIQDVERERDAAKETAKRIARAAARIVQQLPDDQRMAAVAALEAAEA